MKNRWVAITGPNGSTCYGQVEDAGPSHGQCLGFDDLDGDHDKISWHFVDEAGVPDGPFRRIVTTSGVML
jgi:hypothetical protein